MVFESHQKPRFLAVVGPTASGKSAVAMSIAGRCNGQIICCDSVQLYRGFDIGSAKPSVCDQQQIPHHMFDLFSPDEPCDAAIYGAKANSVIDQVVANGAMPIVTGGTGLYLRSITGENWNIDLPHDETMRKELATRDSADLFTELRQLDPTRASQLHQNDRFRVIRALEILKLTGKPVPQPQKLDHQYRNYLVVVMDPPRTKLHEQIHLRTKEMLELGLVEEVQGLLASGVAPNAKPMMSIGYAETCLYLRGELAKAQLQEAIEASTRQYAKRQCTWFKKIPRDYTLSSHDDLGNILPQLLERLS